MEIPDVDMSDVQIAIPSVDELRAQQAAARDAYITKQAAKRARIVKNGAVWILRVVETEIQSTPPTETRRVIRINMPEITKMASNPTQVFAEQLVAAVRFLKKKNFPPCEYGQDIDIEKREPFFALTFDWTPKAPAAAEPSVPAPEAAV